MAVVIQLLLAKNVTPSWLDVNFDDCIFCELGVVVTRLSSKNYLVEAFKLMF